MSPFCDPYFVRLIKVVIPAKALEAPGVMPGVLAVPQPSRLCRKCRSTARNKPFSSSSKRFQRRFVSVRKNVKTSLPAAVTALANTMGCFHAGGGTRESSSPKDAELSGSNTGPYRPAGGPGYATRRTIERANLYLKPAARGKERDPMLPVSVLQTRKNLDLV